MVAGPRFDVAVVGASIAGCTAARLFALAGARVALVEQRPDPGAYKVVCTHQILSSAVPTIERMGLAPLLEARGAVRTHAAAWTPCGGWIRFPTHVPHGYGVTRQTLDPVLRELAAGTPGVELLPGRNVVRLLGEDGRAAGVESKGPNGQAESIRARLVVGADGRNSTVARLAGVPGRVRAHNRFVYFAYWRGVRPRTTKARVWFLNPDGAASFPNEDDLTAVVVAPHRSRLAEFRADSERAYRRMVANLPDSPAIAGSRTRVEADRQARDAECDAPGRGAGRRVRGGRRPRHRPGLRRWMRLGVSECRMACRTDGQRAARPGQPRWRRSTATAARSGGAWDSTTG